MTSDGTPDTRSGTGIAWRCGVVAACVILAVWVLGLERFHAAASPRDLAPFDAAVCLPLAAIFGLGAVALARGTAWFRTACWLAVAVVGQAAALQLTVMGPHVRYQRFQPWGDVLASTPVAGGLLALQAVFVTVAMRSRIAAIGGWLRDAAPGWRLPALLLACLVSGAAVSQDHAAYAAELFAAFAVQLVQLGTILLLAASAPRAVLERVERLAGRLLGADDASAGGARFVLATAACVFVATAALALLVYQVTPHVQDEVKYLLQARYFAAGRLGFPMPPVPEGFFLYLMEEGPFGWYAVTPPGWPAVLAVGERLGAPWLVNPALAAVDIALFHALMRRLYPSRTARLATLLLAVSPWHLFLGMTFMAHQLTLAGVLVGALGVEWVRRTGQARWAWIGGLALGVVVATRQLDGAIAAVLVGLWALGLGGRRLPLRAVAGLVLGCGAVAGALLYYNSLLTGNPFEFPIMAHNDRLFGPGANAYGFGPDRGMGWAIDPNPGHGPVDAIINGALNVSAMNVELFGWGFGSLWLAYFVVLRGRLQRSDKLMLSVVGLTYVAYFFNYFSGGPDFGARYWFLMIVPGAALTARAVHVIGERLDGSARESASGAARAWLAVGALCLVTLVTFMPWRSLDKYKGYRGMAPRLAPLLEERVVAPALVLVRGGEVPDWQTASLLNPFDVNDGGVVYAWDRSAEVRGKLLDAYRDRAVWLVDGPTRTGAGFRVVDGPLRPDQLRERPFGE